MRKIDLNGKWNLRWCDGQRGAMPHFLHSSPSETTLDIKGEPKFIKDDFEAIKWINASVPGEVHLDLMNAGIIKSPYEGIEVLQSRWVEECFWFYRREFDAAETLDAKNAFIKFEGLDYAAIIYLNGNEIARHENAFYPCIVDVTGLLKPTGNVLLVRLESGLFLNSDKPIRNLYTATMTGDVLLHKRNWLRKTQSQMAWDWSPRLMNIGIYKPVEILFGDDILIDEAVVNSEINEKLDNGKIKIRLFAFKGKKLSDKKYKLNISISDEHGVVASDSKEFSALCPNGTFETEIEVENPELWWPAGCGAQKLYTVNYELVSMGETEKTIYNGEKTTGFRHVRVNQETHPVEGNYFIFEINRTPIFMRGANMVPNGLINADFNAERYEKLTDLAIEANFNFLRVWGGGLYEEGSFYDACNRKGIMVWQEFLAACATIPDEESFVASIKKEATYQVRRLANHPSLIAWCGNNEIGWAPEMPEFNVGMDNPLYNEIFPEIIKTEDNDKYYQPTSPWSPDGSWFNSDIIGDQHPWDIGFTNKDSRDYEKKVCRFPNEGGILGPVSLKAMKACLRDGDGIHSFSWQIHDNMLESWMPGSSPDEDVKFWLNKQVCDMSVEEYVYAGGLVQGEGLKRYIENFRRRKFSSSSAVFWMYNDCWPATRSWTIVDYYLNKTPSFNHVRRAFSPVAPIISNEEKGFVFYGVNDLLEDFEGSVTYGVFTAEGEYLEKKVKDVVLPANQSIEIDFVSKSSTEHNKADNAIVFVCLYDKAGKLAGRTRYSALKLFELSLPSAQIKYKRVSGGCVLESNVFVMGISLGIEGDESLGDNFFDLYPNQPYFVETNQIGDNMIKYDLNSYLGAETNLTEVK